MPTRSSAPQPKTQSNHPIISSLQHEKQQYFTFILKIHNEGSEKGQNSHRKEGIEKEIIINRNSNSIGCQIQPLQNIALPEII